MMKIKTKRIAFISILLLLCFQSNAQTDSLSNGNKPNRSPSNRSIFTFVITMPEFTDGGDEGFCSYVKQNFVYPSAAEKTKGNIYVEFIIENDGTVSNTNIFYKKGLNVLLDQAAIDVVSKSPLWKPGENQGKAVPVKRVVIIEFSSKGIKSCKMMKTELVVKYRPH